MRFNFQKLASKIVLFGSLIAFLPISCSKETTKPPANLIDKETFSNLIIEFQLVQSLLNSYNDTLLVIRVRDSILVNYQISLEQFYSSEKWYHNNIEEYQAILNQAMDVLSEEQTRLLDNKKSSAKDSLILNESVQNRPIQRKIDSDKQP